ncbi:MAG: QueT transporter family protein [Erysipelotrichaceae bacterium]|nr:QueT transporter family protein [Erysipelotrichaceae bacterium]
MNKRERLLHLAQGGIIAAAYAALTLIFAPISFGPVQIRIAESLSILPMFTKAAVPGLFIGCILGNLLGGAVITDVIFGSVATLIGAYLGYLLRKNRWLVPIPTVISNTVIIPLVLYFGYDVQIPIYLMMLYIMAGEFVGSFLLGEVLGDFLLRHKKSFFHKEYNE